MDLISIFLRTKIDDVRKKKFYQNFHKNTFLYLKKDNKLLHPYNLISLKNLSIKII